MVSLPAISDEVAPGEKIQLTPQSVKIKGARMPKRADFERLRKNLGHDSQKGFSPYLADGKTPLLPFLDGNWLYQQAGGGVDSRPAYFNGGLKGNLDGHGRSTTVVDPET